MRRSLRWRLQGWYASVLLAVVGGFATLLYAQVRAAKFAAIDAALTADAQKLDRGLRPLFAPPRRPGDARPGPPPGPGEGGGPPPFDGPADREPDGPPFDRPPPDRGPRDRPGPPPPLRERFLGDLRLSPRSTGATPGAEYFVIWRSDRSVLKEMNRPAGVAPPELEPGVPPDTAYLSWRGDYREAAAIGPGATTILVGRSIAAERAELNRFAWQLAAAGVAVLAIGLAGGWLASARILRPIAAISTTASAISATNLSERIDTAQVDRELEELARVLNETFARLEAAFDRQARFTADASHELRTPLTVLRSQAQLALSRPRSAEDYRKTIEECLLATERMTALVEGLLTLARADAGKLDLRRERVDLKRVVSEVVTQLRPLADEFGTTVETKLTATELHGDAGRLGQVLTNLVANAIRYNRPGGRVTVQIGTTDGEAILTIADTGLGIPEADQPHIFERFYRVSKDRSRQSGGSGLGLAISKSIIEGHDGTISFTSQADQGTTFEVRLPINTQDS